MYRKSPSRESVNPAWARIVPAMASSQAKTPKVPTRSSVDATERGARASKRRWARLSERRSSKSWETTAIRENAIPIWPLVAPAIRSSRGLSRRSTTGPAALSTGPLTVPSISRRSAAASARSSAAREASGSLVPPPAVSTLTSTTPKKRWMIPCTVSTDCTCSRGIVRSFF
jgi:hypothetical protein